MLDAGYQKKERVEQHRDGSDGLSRAKYVVETGVLDAAVEVCVSTASR